MRRGPGGDHQPATDADTLPVARMRRAVLAGHQGDADRARHLACDTDPAVRAAALGALARLDVLDEAVLARAARDPDAGVRRRACLVVGRALGAGGGPRHALAVVLDRLHNDEDASVVESAAWAVGEAGSACGASGVDTLMGVARSHPDPLCREAAVAALGAVGDPRALDVVIAALGDRAQVRRRAAVALAAFGDPRADDALRRCLEDRDWQVRQAAEDLLGGR